MAQLTDLWDLFDSVRQGNGLTYIHTRGGKADYVLMDMDRFQKEEGGSDPGHDDEFAHSHVQIKLTKNAVECRQCGKVVESKYRHDFVGCGCPAEIFTDGGLDYLRRGAKDLEDIIDRSEWTVE